MNSIILQFVCSRIYTEYVRTTNSPSLESADEIMKKARSRAASWKAIDDALLKSLLGKLSFYQYLRKNPDLNIFGGRRIDRQCIDIYRKEYELYKKSLASLYFILNAFPLFIDNEPAPWVIDQEREMLIYNETLRNLQHERITLQREYDHWENQRSRNHGRFPQWSGILLTGLPKQDMAIKDTLTGILPTILDSQYNVALGGVKKIERLLNEMNSVSRFQCFEMIPAISIDYLYGFDAASTPLRKWHEFNVLKDSTSFVFLLRKSTSSQKVKSAASVQTFPAIVVASSIRKTLKSVVDFVLINTVVSSPYDKPDSGTVLMSLDLHPSHD